MAGHLAPEPFWSFERTTLWHRIEVDICRHKPAVRSLVNVHLDGVVVARNSVAPFGYPRGARQGPQRAKSGFWNFNFIYQPFASLPAFEGDKMLRALPAHSNLNVPGGHRKITLNDLGKVVAFPAGGKALHHKLPLNLQILVHFEILAEGF